MINLILFCFGTAGLTMFLDMCMQEGMILHRYYKIIEKLPVWLFKPIGGCCYCLGGWLFICTYLITIFFIKSVFSENSFILALFGVLGIGINYVFIKLIDRI
jgi:hypothetical protein